MSKINPAFTKMLKSQSTNFDNLTKKLKETGSKYKDERYWELKRDQNKNGYAVIRFLPPSEDSESSIVTIMDHWFKGPNGQIYNEKSLNTFGEPDPLGEYISTLWATEDEDKIKEARRIKKRTQYHSNILVIKDPACPENEGKAFLYHYGKKIMDKLKDLMIPKFEDEEAIDPFDIMNGCNFKVKTCDVGGWVNYDNSSFAAPSKLCGDDKEKQFVVWQACHNLDELLDRKHFKTYEQLKDKMNSVLCLSSNEEIPVTTNRPAPVADEIPEASSTTDATAAWDDEDDDAAFFNNLANS